MTEILNITRSEFRNPQIHQNNKPVSRMGEAAIPQTNSRSLLRKLKAEIALQKNIQELHVPKYLKLDDERAIDLIGIRAVTCNNAIDLKSLPNHTIDILYDHGGLISLVFGHYAVNEKKRNEAYKKIIAHLNVQ